LIDLRELFRKIRENGFSEVALNSRLSRVNQVRFSNNSKDITNIWVENQVEVFAATEHKYVSTVVKDVKSADAVIEFMKGMIKRIPESSVFKGLNPIPQNYPGDSAGNIPDTDEHEMVEEMISAAVERGAERTAGLLYRKVEETEVLTNYNDCSFETGGYEAVIRSFRGEETGQEGIHFGPGSRISASAFRQIGKSSADSIEFDLPAREIEPAKYKVILSPYVIGNILSYASGFFSYYYVETGISCFAGKVGEKVASNAVNLEDNPLDSKGVGYRICDDEGTATRVNRIIENGVLKTYVHSYSTAQRSGSETTGNAGIIYPVPFQLELLPGSDRYERMVSELDHGILINNAWYTRFQDYRNGVFSTVPRDGIFIVENGEIVARGKGIRISDSVPNILGSIRGVSKEAKYVKWWEEVFPSLMPYVQADDIYISKAF